MPILQQINTYNTDNNIVLLIRQLGQEADLEQTLIREAILIWQFRQNVTVYLNHP